MRFAICRAWFEWGFVPRSTLFSELSKDFSGHLARLNCICGDVVPKVKAVYAHRETV